MWAHSQRAAKDKCPTQHLLWLPNSGNPQIRAQGKSTNTVNPAITAQTQLFWLSFQAGDKFGEELCRKNSCNAWLDVFYPCYFLPCCLSVEVTTPRGLVWLFPGTLSTWQHFGKINGRVCPSSGCQRTKSPQPCFGSESRSSHKAHEPMLRDKNTHKITKYYLQWWPCQGTVHFTADTRQSPLY